MKAETLNTIKVEPYKSLKEKTNIVKRYDGKAKIQVYRDYIYIKQIRREIK